MEKIMCNLKMFSIITEKFSLGNVLHRMTLNCLDLPTLQYYSYMPCLPIQSIFSSADDACLQKRSCNKVKPPFKLTIHNFERDLTSAEKESISLLFSLISCKSCSLPLLRLCASRSGQIWPFVFTCSLWCHTMMTKPQLKNQNPNCSLQLFRAPAH